jgi:uncharacterized protein (TIGR03118 family)
MIGHGPRARGPLLAAALALAALVAGAALGAPGGHGGTFTVHNLVSDQSGVADHTDGNLQNAWGLAASATSPWWIADNHSSLATVYDSTGGPFPPPPAAPLVVSVPSDPTGLVASTDSAFSVGTGASAGPSRFIFSTEDGKILGWHGGLPAAILGKDESPGGAVYKGLAIANDHLYATDFHNARVDVFDSGFTPVTPAGAFVDPTIPPGFAPFGIQALGGNIFVTYAKQDAAAMDDAPGHGLGFVDEYDTSGTLLGRVASRGDLDAPWGLAIAPPGFGDLGGDLLVGNFGDGRINVFAPAGEDRGHGRLVHARLDHGSGSDDGNGDGPGDEGDDDQGATPPAAPPQVGPPAPPGPPGPGHGMLFEPRGQLHADHGGPIRIDGLWALQFGMGGANNGPVTTLFFTAGPNGESDGLFGTITTH